MLDADELQLWQDYRANAADCAARNRLITRYMPLVVHQAQRMHDKTGGKVDLDYLSQAGVFGLMNAIELFDLSRGLQFSTYAPLRIHGAILDELRKFDWVPRLVREKATELDRMVQLGGEPSEELRCSAHVVNQVSTTTETSDGETGAPRTIADGIESKEESPSAASQRHDLLRLVTKGLTKNERLIVIMYYYEHQSMKEIGEQLGLSESRVSQMHSSIIKRLKFKLHDRVEEFV